MLTEPDQTSHFEIHVNEVGFRLRRVLAELGASVRVDISQPRIAARELGVDKTLAWRISKIAAGSDPVAAMSMMPGAVAQKALLRAFANAGASEELLGRARQALDEFERMVRDHAGDRETFEVLLSSLANGDPQAREAQRRQAFQGNSAVWGVQCRVRTWTYILAPGAESPDRGDMAMIGSYVDMCRFRRNAEWPLAAVGVVDERGNHVGAPIQPILPSQRNFAQDPSLPEYCRGEVPAIRRERRTAGALEYRMEGGPVGRTAAFDWAAGWKYPDRVTRWALSEDGEVGLAMNVMVPTELAQLDVLVHKEFWSEPPTHLKTYSLMPGEPLAPQPGVPRREIEVHQRVERLAEGLAGLAVHDVPDYAGMIEAAIKAMGHSPASFTGSRVRMKYPILATAIVLLIGLPTKPATKG